MSEQEMGFPQTADGGSNFIQPGLQKMRIDKIVKWIDFTTKKPKEDKRGYPGLYITFVNEQNQFISSGFYYSTDPLDSPNRADDALKCKSEYFLTNLKTALGFGTENVSPEKLKSVWCWGAIGKDVIIDGNGKPTGDSFSFLVKKFFPDGVRPAIAGDPMLPQSGGIASGIFYQESIDRKKATTTTAPPERTAPTQQQAAAQTSIEEGKADDMPIDEF